MIAHTDTPVHPPAQPLKFHAHHVTQGEGFATLTGDPRYVNFYPGICRNSYRCRAQEVIIDFMAIPHILEEEASTCSTSSSWPAG